MIPNQASDDRSIGRARPLGGGASSGGNPDSESLRRTIQSELIPKLMLAHRAGPLPPEVSRAAGRELGPEEVEEFVERIRHGPGREVRKHVQELREGGADAEAVYMDLVAPAARRLGELWEEEECDFVQVTVALGRMQRVLRSLAPYFQMDADPAECPGRALLTCIPGEEHSLGLIMLAEFFVREGWAVQVGAPFESAEVLEMVRERHFDLVGFSVACDSNIHMLPRHIRRVRENSANEDVVVMVGGRVFRDRPQLSDRVGAHATAPDAREAVAVAGSLCSKGGRGNGAR